LQVVVEQCCSKQRRMRRSLRNDHGAEGVNPQVSRSPKAMKLAGACPTNPISDIMTKRGRTLDLASCCYRPPRPAQCVGVPVSGCPGAGVPEGVDTPL
jgi:hypothetical protein